MANRRFIDFPIASTVGDNDIILIWQEGLNKQTTKATLLSGLPEDLADLNDVVISGLTNGQILRYNSTTGVWENTDQGNLDLNDLNDVTIVSPSNGQVLVYNSSTSKWENSSGGYVPYTGAVTTVDLGAQTIQAGSFVKVGGTSAQFLKADGSIDSNTYLTTGSAAATYVPYTGATADVNLGTHDLTAERGTFQNNGSSDTLTVNHTSGSGYGIIVTKGGNNEALYVSKTSGSGNAMTVVGGRTSLVDLALSSVTNTAGDFLTISGGVVHKRTAAEVRTDIGAGTGNGTVTSVGLSSATSGVTIGSTPVTTSGTITIAIATASGSQNGLLSSTDWSTFNSKQNALTNPVTGTGSAGQVAYWSSSSAITGESNLFWDATNDKLSIGTATAYGNLTVSGSDDTDIITVLAGPNSRLHVGSVTSGTNVYVRSQNNYGLTLGVNTISYLSIFNSGNVFIGTSATDLGFKLDVNGTGRFSGNTTITGNLTLNGAVTRNINFFDSSNTNLNAQIQYDQISSNSGQLFFGTNNSGTFSTKLTIANTGAATFSSSVTAASNYNLINNAGSVGALVFIESSVNKAFVQYLSPTFSTAARANSLEFGTISSGSFISFRPLDSEAMRITSGGNVGIGDTNPTSSAGWNPKLVLNATTAALVVKGINGQENTFGSSNGLYIDSLGNSTGSNNQIVFRTSASNSSFSASTRMTIAANGNIGAPSGSNIYNASDLRLKKNIVKIYNGLDKICALNPIKFNWVDGFEISENNKEMLGFVAQEVFEIIPEAVEAFGNNSIILNDMEIKNPLRVNEKFIIPVLVKAIQELKQEIETLKN